MTRDPMLDGITRYDSDDYDVELPEKPDGIYVLFSDLLALITRVREDERKHHLRDAEQYGYEAGRSDALDAARDAVAALLGKTVPPSDGVTEALAALDALRGAE